MSAYLDEYYTISPNVLVSIYKNSQTPKAYSYHCLYVLLLTHLTENPGHVSSWKPLANLSMCFDRDLNNTLDTISGVYLTV